MRIAEVSCVALCAAMVAGTANAQTNSTSSDGQSTVPAAAPSPPSTDQTPAPTGATTQTASQVEGAVPASTGVGDIIVTAQRRSENLQKVPISVTAVTMQTLQANGVINAASLPTVVPGLVIQRTYAGLNPYLRGIGSITSGFTAEQPVAIYIDGIYLPNAASSIFAFNNIERIEVLKGPQGTLFGRNAVGGLINVVTRDPTTTPHVEGSVGYGNYQTYDASVYASTGLAKNLAIDFAALFHDQVNGWGVNYYTGHEIFTDRELSFSSKLKWTPTGQTTVTLRGFYDHTHTSQGVSFGVFPGSTAVDGEKFISKYVVGNPYDPYNVSTQENVGLKIEQNLGFANLVSLSGYNHIHSDFMGDSNGIVGKLTPGQFSITLHNYGAGKTFTQEVQLLSNDSSPFKWIVGAFYLHDVVDLLADTLPLCVAGVCAAAPTAIHSRASQITNSYAAFGEVTFNLGQTTRLTGGLRYTHDHKDESGAFRQPLPGYGAASPATLPPPNFFGDINSNVSPTASFSKVTWRAVLAHDFSPAVMAYASYNRGFKAGSYNLTAFANPVVAPEVLDAFEVGVKSTFLDHKVRLNLSGFYYDYKNIQLRTLAPPAPPGLAILYNAAEAHIKGIDADLVLAPTSHLTITAAATYVDARFTSFPGGTCTTPRVITGTVLGGDVSTPCVLDGYHLARAPEFTGNINATYRVPTAVGEFALNASDAYNGGFFWDVDNRLRQQPYHQVNMSVTWTSPDKRYNAQLYVHNLNQPFYLIGVTTASNGTDDYTPGDPRTYGLKVGFNF